MDHKSEQAAGQILVVDDDAELCKLVSRYLGAEGYSVDTVQTSALGIERTLAGGYDLVVLDVMLPDIDGFEVLRRIRATLSTPVLMLTARGDDLDRILGLEIGADDYLSKPFNTRELSARIRAILRRVSRTQDSGTAADGASIRIGDLELNPGLQNRSVQRRSYQSHDRRVRSAPKTSTLRRSGCGSRGTDEGRIGTRVFTIRQEYRHARLEPAQESREVRTMAPRGSKAFGASGINTHLLIRGAALGHEKPVPQDFPLVLDDALDYRGDAGPRASS